MKPLKSALADFFKQHQIDIADNLLEGVWIEDKEYENDIYEQLFFVFEDHGVVLESEHGTSAEDGLSDVVLHFFDLINVEGWRIRLAKTIGKKVQFELANDNGNNHEFNVEVESSDWTPPELFDELNKFAKLYADLSVIYLPVDDPYRIVAFPHAISDELLQLLNSYIKPYDVF